MISVFCMIPVFLAYLGIIYSPDNKLWIDMVCLALWVLCISGHFIAGVSALDYTSKKAVGTAPDLLGYLVTWGV